MAGRKADIEDHRRVAGDVVDIASGGVDEEDLAVRSDSVALMYVTVDVIFRFDPPLN